MVMSTIATATMPPATSSTRMMLPPRRAGSWAFAGWRDRSWSVSAVMRRDAACRHRGNALSRLSPECLNRARKRKPVKPAFCWLRSFPAHFLAETESRPPAGQPALEAHDVADNLADCMIVFHRDLVVDLHGGMQGPRQRHVLDDGNIVLAGDFPDLERDGIDALGHADRRRHAALVGKRHRVVGRVGDDDGGLGNRGHHPLLHPRL